MSDAPERIWTWPNAVHPDAGSWVSDSHHKDDDCGQHEYVRADLYEAVMKDRAETYSCLIACTEQREDLKRQVAELTKAQPIQGKVER